MKTIVVLLNNRKALERVENMTFSNDEEMVAELRDNGMSDEEEETLEYHELTDFMCLVNDQVLDDLQGTFLGYVNFNI